MGWKKWVTQKEMGKKIRTPLKRLNFFFFSFFFLFFFLFFFIFVVYHFTVNGLIIYIPCRYYSIWMNTAHTDTIYYENYDSINVERCTYFFVADPQIKGCHVDPFLSLLVYFTYTKRTYCYKYNAGKWSLKITRPCWILPTCEGDTSTFPSAMSILTYVLKA